MAIGTQICLQQRTSVLSPSTWPCRRAWSRPGVQGRGHYGPRQRGMHQPVRAQHSIVTVSAAHPAAGNSIAVAEALDSPLSLLALMAVPIGIYFMFRILLWDYTSRRTDDPNNPDRRQSFSVSARPGPGIMAETNPAPPVRHLVRDPALQAMATQAAGKVADAVRQATAEYESEVKLRSMNNGHVGALEWDWVCSMLQGRGGASQSFLAKARQQVQQGQPASTEMAVSTMLAELVAEQQALKEATHICQTLSQARP